jgi:cytochrome c oxidase subunit 1
MNLPRETIALPRNHDLIRRRIFSVDHKVIGLQYLFSTLIFFALGGLLAALMRWQLAWPTDPNHPVPILGKLMGWPGGFLPAEMYNVVLTLHATLMIFFVVIPIQVGAFGNYLIPLKIGSRDMAFPFLNGLSFWLFIPAATIMLSGVCLPGNAAATGWTAYPPLSTIPFNGGGAVPAAQSLIPFLQNSGSTWGILPIAVNLIAFGLMFGFVGSQLVRTGNGGLDLVLTLVGAIPAAIGCTRLIQSVAFDGQSCWFLSLILIGASGLMGAINYITTIIKFRCPGLTMLRLPLTVWNLLIASLIILFATPALACVLIMQLLDHHHITSFFEASNWVLSNQIQNNAGGGYVLLDPHLFWFYSHPAVYIMILPAMGIVSDILSVFSRKPIFGYLPMVFASGVIALVGFLVWGHHMFQSGMNPTLGAAFAASTILIAVPSGVKTFNWLGTLWGGKIHLQVPMLFAIAFLSLFVIGGLSGIVMASSAIDVQVHNTYYIVAHIHYVLFGGSVFGIFAGIYFWYPKMFGRMMNPTLGTIHFVLTYITFNCTFFAMHILGLAGMPRRMADYTHYTLWAHLQPMNQFISFSAFAMTASQLLFVFNFFGSWLWGKPAGNNPWNATTLEWMTSSPPPAENFAVLPTVSRGAYEYSVPGEEKDWIGQWEKESDANVER